MTTIQERVAKLQKKAEEQRAIDMIQANPYQPKSVAPATPSPVASTITTPQQQQINEQKRLAEEAKKLGYSTSGGVAYESDAQRKFRENAKMLGYSQGVSPFQSGGALAGAQGVNAKDAARIIEESLDPYKIAQKDDLKEPSFYGLSGKEDIFKGTPYYKGDQPVVSKAFTSAPPTMEEGEDPRDFQNRYLTWERDEARDAHKEIMEATKGARAFGSAQIQKSAQEQAKSFGEKLKEQDLARRKNQEKVNPAFAALSEQEKMMNAYTTDEKGNLVPVEKGKEKIPEKISAWSGRDPIADKLSADQKLEIARANREIARAKGSAIAVTPENYDKLDDFGKSVIDNKRAIENAKSELAEQKEAGVSPEQIKSGLTKRYEDMRTTLGLTESQDFTINDDGTIKVIDKETRKEVNRAEQAAKDYEEETQKEISRMNKENNAQKQAITRLYSNENGVLSYEGKRLLMENETEYSKTVGDYIKERRKGQEEVYIKGKQEQLRQSRLFVLEPAKPKTTAERNAEASAKAKEKAINEIINSNLDAKGNPIYDFNEAAEIYNKRTNDLVKEPTLETAFNSFNRITKRADFNQLDAFGEALAQQGVGGDFQKARKIMEMSGYSSSFIDMEEEKYQRDVQGKSEHQIGLARIGDLSRKVIAGDLKIDSLLQIDSIADKMGLPKETLAKIFRGISLTTQDGVVAETANDYAEQLAPSKDQWELQKMGEKKLIRVNKVTGEVQELYGGGIGGDMTAYEDMPQEWRKEALSAELVLGTAGDVGEEEHKRFYDRFAIGKSEGKSPQRIVKEYLGADNVGEEETPLLNFLFSKLAGRKGLQAKMDFIGSLAAAKNLEGEAKSNQVLNAITLVEEERFKSQPVTKGQMNTPITMATLNEANEIEELGKEIGASALGRLDRVWSSLMKLSSDEAREVIEGMAFGVEEGLEDKVIAYVSKVGRFFSKERNFLAGVAVTITEEKSFSSFIGDVNKDNQASMIGKIRASKNFVARAHNEFRKAVLLPELSIEEMTDDNKKLQRYSEISLPYADIDMIADSVKKIEKAEEVISSGFFDTDGTHKNLKSKTGEQLNSDFVKEYSALSEEEREMIREEYGLEESSVQAEEYIEPKQGFRTDRHNNPTAMTTSVAETGGLEEGIDYEIGDPFTGEGGKVYYTARLLGDPVEKTIKAIDKMGFQTDSGAPRWTHTNIEKAAWDAMSNQEKVRVIKNMYKNEGGRTLQLGDGSASEQEGAATDVTQERLYKVIFQ